MGSLHRPATTGIFFKKGARFVAYALTPKYRPV